jgi:hypothetical protein
VLVTLKTHRKFRAQGSQRRVCVRVVDVFGFEAEVVAIVNLA